MISVIIPVYNAAATVERCVRSLTEQTYPYLELVLIDDGSTDQSLAICQAFAQQDNRIRVYTQENAGVSAARNSGLDKVTGDYVAFTDADDFWEPHGMETLLDALLRFDAAVCGSYEMDKPCSEGEPTYCALEQYDFTRADAQLVVWGVLYKRALLDGIRFHEDIYLAEDTLFVSTAISKAGGLAHTHKKLYHYEIYAESASHGDYSPKKYTELFAWEQIMALFSAAPAVQATCRAAFAELCGRRYREYSRSPRFTADVRRELVRAYRQNLPFLLRQPLGIAKKGKFILFGMLPRVYAALLNKTGKEK